MLNCKHLRLIVLCLPLLIFNSAQASKEFHSGEMAKEAPIELMHWGQLVGQWSTTEESLKADGSGWQASNSADWDFMWAFNGWGIQDNYTSPPMRANVSAESI